jgi:hypothetical protein
MSPIALRVVRPSILACWTPEEIEGLRRASQARGYHAPGPDLTPLPPVAPELRRGCPPDGRLRIRRKPEPV